MLAPAMIPLLWALAAPNRADGIGTISIPGPGTIAIWQRDDIKEYSTETGVVSLPANRYQLSHVTLLLADAVGKRSRAEITLTDSSRAVRVRPGLNAEIVCGPPFTLSVTIGSGRDRTLALAHRTDRPVELTQAGPRDQSVRAVCRDRAGNIVRMIICPDGRKTAPPEFRARTIVGALVESSPFDYG